MSGQFLLGLWVSFGMILLLKYFIDQRVIHVILKVSQLLK